MARAIWFGTFSMGLFGVAEDGAGICRVLLPGEESPAGFEERETPLLRRAMEQLREYFAGERSQFELPLSLHGTPFQLSVWRALGDIPYGETRSYRQIAGALQRPNACRAVGGANHVNPVPILVPCHRVIGRDGSLTGYRGGLPLKERLLRLERGGKNGADLKNPG